jgi:subtilisin family serine protease
MGRMTRVACDICVAWVAFGCSAPAVGTRPARESRADVVCSGASQYRETLRGDTPDASGVREPGDPYHVPKAWAVEQSVENPSTVWSPVAPATRVIHPPDPNREVRVAVIDSGCADPANGRLHHDLARYIDADGREVPSPIRRQFTVTRGNVLEQPAPDRVGHGIGVIGIIAAQARNQFGMQGVAPHVRVDCIQVLDDRGSASDADLATAIELARQLGDRVLNLSLQGARELRRTKRALQLFVQAGGLVVVARGNARTADLYTPSYPAMYSAEGARQLGHVVQPWQYGVIAVAATLGGDRASVVPSLLRDGVTVLAPGSRVLTLAYARARNKDCTLVDTEQGLALCSGTSFAAPFVTGAIAHAWSLRPELANMQIRAWLFDAGAGCEGCAKSHGPQCGDTTPRIPHAFDLHSSSP